LSGKHIAVWFWFRSEVGVGAGCSSIRMRVLKQLFSPLKMIAYSSFPFSTKHHHYFHPSTLTNILPHFSPLTISFSTFFPTLVVINSSTSSYYSLTLCYFPHASLTYIVPHYIHKLLRHIFHFNREKIWSFFTV